MGAHRCGVVAIAGRPNVGKSTLMNRLLGAKVAIVTPRPQTTRDRILGVRSDTSVQFLFQDTPGIHSAHKALNRRMVAEAQAALDDCDVVIVLTDAREPEAGLRDDGPVLDRVRRSGRAAVLALNKIDVLRKPALLPLIDAYRTALDFRAIVPVSARNGDGLDRLLAEVERLLPEGPSLYADDDLTDRPMRFVAAEIVREKLMLATRQEVPYSCAVTIDLFEEPEPPQAVRIAATIHVEKASQKAIVIGRGGAMLKRIGSEARAEIEAMIERRVFLELFVRVEEEWAASEQGLRKVGYEAPGGGAHGSHPDPAPR